VSDRKKPLAVSLTLQNQKVNRNGCLGMDLQMHRMAIFSADFYLETRPPNSINQFEK
jgi:hypothetical protein